METDERNEILNENPDAFGFWNESCRREVAKWAEMYAEEDVRDSKEAAQLATYCVMNIFHRTVLPVKAVQMQKQA